MLDVQQLDESLKLRSFARLLATKHPALALVREKLDMSDFFFPKIKCTVDPVASTAVKLLKGDRQKIWEKQDTVIDNRILMQLIYNIKLRNAVNATGKLSIPFFNMVSMGKY